MELLDASPRSCYAAVVGAATGLRVNVTMTLLSCYCRCCRNRVAPRRCVTAGTAGAVSVAGAAGEGLHCSRAGSTAVATGAGLLAPLPLPVPRRWHRCCCRSRAAGTAAAAGPAQLVLLVPLVLPVHCCAKVAMLAPLMLPAPRRVGPVSHHLYPSLPASHCQGWAARATVSQPAP